MIDQTGPKNPRHIGVMLAAGEATRLPYKALLPLRDGHCIAIESGLDLLYKTCARVVVVVRGDDSMIPRILWLRRWKALEYCVQRGDGVVAALATARQHFLHTGTDLSRSTAYVTFCDNVFTNGERLPEKIDRSCAAVRCLPKPAMTHLDGWRDGAGWVRRDQQPELALAGWYALKGGSMPTHDYASMSSVQYLNAVAAQPHACDEERTWWDIGTVESYAAYMARE